MSEHDASTDDTIDLDQLVLEDAKLSETLEALTERRAQIRAVLARALDVGTHDVGGRQVIVTQPGRLNAKAFARDHPVEQHPELYAPALSTAAVHDTYSPAELREHYTTVGAKQVRVQ